MVELSSLDVLFLARELSVLEDAYIDKVHELGPDEFLFRTRHPQRGRTALLVRSGAFVCLVAEPPESPESPTTFASLLRKHLVTARIRRVDQHGFDRVLVFSLERHGEPVRLIAELFGKGNLVLVGADGKTVLAQRTETYRDRTIKRGEEFRFPPSRVNPIELDPTTFEALAQKSERDAVRFLAVECSFGGDLAEELVARANVPKKTKAKDLRAEELADLWRAWQGLLHGEPKPTLARGPQGARIEAVEFVSPAFASYVREPQPSLSAAIDCARSEAQAAAAPPVDEERARLERQVEHQRAAIEVFAKEADEVEATGRFVYEHYAAVEGALKSAREALEDKEWGPLSKAPLPTGWKKVDPTARRIFFLIEGRELVLDPSASLDNNASRFFEEAKRVRAKAESAKAALADAEARLSKAQVAAAKPVVVRPKAPTKRFWFESYRWFYTSDGFLVVGGRDAASNEKLVKKHLATGDVYFHADFHGAPSCVLKAAGAKVAEASLREAAQFAVTYSKAFAQFASGDAFWVKPEQVSKTAPTGEFVSKGAFIVRGERNYVRQLPLEVEIGACDLTKEGRPGEPSVARRLMGGPPSAVRRWTKQRFLVRRGSLKASDAAKHIGPKLGVTLDEVQGVLPPGTVAVEEAAKP